MAGRESQQPRTLLEFLLQQRDLTYEEVAEEFANAARRLDERGVTISTRHLRRLASGERMGTNPATRRVLQAVFGRSAQELLQPYDAAASSAGTGPSAAAGDAQLDVDILTAAAERSREFAMTSHLPVSPEAIGGLEDEVRELAHIYLVTPLPEILGRLVNVQDSVFSQLEQRQKPVNARQLYFLAAIVGGILGYAADDIGKPQLALNHTRTAFMWAEYADDNGLRAWIRGLQSLISFWANRPHEAIRYAEAGSEFASVARSTSAPWLYSGLARAHAALGDATQAKSLIEQADRARDRVGENDLDDFGGLCSFLPARQTYYAARTLASLPEEAARAERYSLEAVAAYADPSQPGWDFSCLADSRLSLALARAGRGEFDGVLEPLQPVLDLPPEQRISEFNKTMNLLHKAMNGPGAPRQAREIQEAIEGFTRVSLSSFPI
jgi:tetratricopeptide (TPR) repeat protein